MPSPPRRLLRSFSTLVGMDDKKPKVTGKAPAFGRNPGNSLGNVRGPSDGKPGGKDGGDDFSALGAMGACGGGG